MDSRPETHGQDDLRPLDGTLGTKGLPTTRRGLRTRAALVAAARVVFERDGYLAARIVDIPSEARVATGTFYTYFKSKEEIFAAVLEAAQDDMLHPGLPHLEDSTDPGALIEASNRAYLTAFLRNAKLMVLMHQVATIDEDFRELRRRRAARFAERNARFISDLQEQGLADVTLDPLLTSMALSGMVSRVAMDVLWQEKCDLEEVVDVVTRLWINGLKIEQAA